MKRILIVDDDPDIHELLKLALQDPDRVIESAWDGIEGLRRVEEADWDLVFTDVMMPGMDGMELLERIHDLKPEIPVVVMTVASTADRIVSAIRENAFSWFSKPFTLEAVREMASSALSGETAGDDIRVLSASPRWLTVKLRCKMETAARIVQFIRELDSLLPIAERDDVSAAFREILLNAIEHGGRNDPRQSVTISYVHGENALFYYVRDPGQGFSFNELPHAAISNPAESPFEHAERREQMGLRPGGFGILVTRALVDELIYNEAGNEVLLVKYLRKFTA